MRISRRIVSAVVKRVKVRGVQRSRMFRRRTEEEEEG